MEFDQLMIDILVEVSCKFEMYIFKIAQVINENLRIAFLYVLSIRYIHLSNVLTDHPNNLPYTNVWLLPNNRIKLLILHLL